MGILDIFDRTEYSILPPGEDPTRERQQLQGRGLFGSFRIPCVVWLFVPMAACALSGFAAPVVSAWVAGTPPALFAPAATATPLEAPATVTPTETPTATPTVTATATTTAATPASAPPDDATPLSPITHTPEPVASPTAIVERVIVRETVIVPVTQIVDRRVQVNVPVQVTSIVQVTTVVQVTAPPVVWTAAPQATYTPYPTYTPPPTATPWIITATPEPTATLAPQELTPAWVYLPTIWR